MSTVPMPPTGQPEPHHVSLSRDELMVFREHLLQARPFCHYCGIRLVRNGATLDHVLPLSRGGDDRPSNLVLACKVCNDRKSDRTAKEFFEGNPVLDVKTVTEKLKQIAELCVEVQEQIGTFRKRDRLVVIDHHNFDERPEIYGPQLVAFPEGGAE